MKFSFSQNGEDILLWRCFKGQKTGFYVDVGASSPIRDSVTHLFYEAGWSGLNFEPVAERAAELNRARPRDITICAAVSDETGAIDITRTKGIGGLSTIMPLNELKPAFEGNSWSVPTEQITLTDALAKTSITVIDFLKVDVEGAEARVLRGFDLKRWRPSIILIESTKPLSAEENHSLWEGLLLDADYISVWFDGLNRYYVASEKAHEFKNHFTVAPNVFDGFTSFQALGHPLRNASHPDHEFAIHFAGQLLRAIGVENDAQIEAAMLVDMPPAQLQAEVVPETIREFFYLVLARSPSSEETEALTRAQLTGSELIRHLLRSDEFRNRRARIAI